MKSLLNELKKCSQNKYQNTFVVTPAHCHKNGKLNTMVILEQIERLQEEPTACLKKVAPHYKKDLQHVSVQFYHPATAGDTLVLEAKFYEVDKRTVQLKIFVRKIKPDHSSKRICRAKYDFKAIYESNEAA